MKSILLSTLLILSLGLPAYAYPPSTTLNAPPSYVETRLTAPDADTGDEFGRAVAVHGDDRWL